MLCPSCGAGNDEAADACFKCGKGLFVLTDGALLASRYEIRSPLGKGGMGMVYKAHDRELDEIVAIKVLRPEISASASMAKRFRSEIKLARKVRHPNVCAIHEYGQHGHLRFIVMELVQGVDLKRTLREGGPLEPREAYAVSIQVADGLQAVHNVGVVHRDLKTANIMRDAGGCVRLMDFGIAKQFECEASTGATGTGQIVGTPEYMSPEQCQGQKVDPRSDVYALGVVVWELFVGEVPFRGDTPVSTIFKHIQDPPPLDGPAGARLPPALRPVLARALAKRPEDRFASAGQMASALRQVSAQSSSAGAPAPVPGWAAALANPMARPTPVRAPVATPVATPVPTPVPTAVATVSRTSVETAAHPLSRLPIQRGFSRWLVAVPAGLLAAGVLAVTFVSLRSQPSTPAGPPSIASGRQPVTTVAATTVPETPAPPTSAPSVAVAVPTAPPPTTGPRVVGAASPARLTPVDQGRQVPPASQTLPTPGPSAARETPPPPRVVSAMEPARTPDSAPALAPPTGLAPVSAPETPRPPQPDPPGVIGIKAKPWAEVVVDGKPVGRTPISRLGLSAGPHAIILNHPDFEPFRRVVTLKPGESVQLAVDLEDEAVRRKR